MPLMRVSWRSLAGWVLGAVTLCVARETSAQVPWSLGRWQGDSTFFLDWEKQDDKRAQTKYETILFQERLGLRTVGGFILDPRLVTFNLGGSFGQSQEDAIALSNNALRVGNGTLYDYAFDSLLLADRPYPITLFANRNQTTLSQGFGGRSDVRFESRGGIFELRDDSFLKDYGFLNFSSLLDVHQELLNEDSSVFGSPFLRDERRSIVRYNAHKGNETSDLDLRYELNDVSDPFNPANIYDSNTVRATHSLDFGPTLNRRLDSSAYYFSRTGSAPGDYLSVDEGLHLDHASNFATDYRYDFSRSNNDAGDTTTHNGSIGLLYELYRRLTTTLSARGTQQDFPNGSKTIAGGQAGLDYRRSLLWSGELFVDTSAGYQVDDNRFTSSTVQVIDERHIAPLQFGAGAGFELDNPNVVNDSIVIVDVDRGRALVPTSDYDVLFPSPIDPRKTFIVPLATATILRPGDALDVTYDYFVPTDLKYSTTTVGTKVGVDFPWVATSYEHTLSDQSRLSGMSPPQFLINENLDRFELDLRHQWNAIRAQSSVAYEILRSTIVDSNAWRFGQLLAYQPRSDFVAQISGDEYLVDYPTENRNSSSFLVRGTVDWWPVAALSVSTFAGYRAFRDTSVPSDEIADCGARLRWTYYNLEVSPSFTWTDYRNRLNDVRGELRIVRRWF